MNFSIGEPSSVLGIVRVINWIWMFYIVNVSQWMLLYWSPCAMGRIIKFHYAGANLSGPGWKTDIFVGATIWKITYMFYNFI